MITYPIGYGTQRIGYTQMYDYLTTHTIHPAYLSDVLDMLVGESGHIGVGSGWRTNPHPVSQASMEGKSFHQYQTFASGIVAYSAIDFVATNPGGRHRAPTWAEADRWKAYGLHAFISGEPWHGQDDQMRGYQTWIDAGRPDPTSKFTPIVIPPTTPLEHTRMSTLPVPVRKYDSRYYDDRQKQPADSTITINLGLDQHIIPDAKVRGVVVNLTVVGAEAPGFITAWGSGSQPVVSNVNYHDGKAVANLAMIPTYDGRIKLYTVAKCHIIVDLQAIEILAP